MRCTGPGHTDAGRARAAAWAMGCLATALLAGPAAAQGLNLGGGAGPGEGRAALALAELLEREAEDLPRDALGGAQAALRAAAARLLRDGENAGSEGSEALLAGLTIAAHREELDGSLVESGPAVAAHVVSVLGGAAPTVVPRRVDLLLRDALAPLPRPGDGACGWWGGNGSDAPELPIEPVRELLGERRLDEAAKAALAELVQLSEAAREEPAFQAAAASWLTLVIDASRALDEPPSWLEMPARDRLRADLSAAITPIFAEPETARAMLRRVADLRAVIGATEGLSANRQSRELREAVNRLVAAPEGDPKREPEAVARIAGTYLRAVALIEADQDMPAADELVRQVRPLLEPLLAAHRTSAGAAERLLPTVLDRPDPMTEPAVLAAMGSLSGTAADLALPARLTNLLTTWTGDPSRPPMVPGREPAPSPDLGAFAQRVSRLAVSAGRADEADAALRELRELAALDSWLFRSPGESSLRSGGQPEDWRAVAGSHRARLTFLLDQKREEWIRASASDGADTALADLRAVAETVELLADGAALVGIARAWGRGNEPVINRWPGVELTPESLHALGEGLPADLQRLAALAARGDDADATLAEARRLRRLYAASIAMARLEGLAAQHEATSCGPVSELAMGPPPPDAWLAEQRRALALLSRAAFEAAASDGERREAFLAQARQQGEQVLAFLEG